VIRITTYLRSGDGTFRPAETCTAPPADPDYIEGAIELNIAGVEIIGKREWDYVDQLWAYICTMSKELRTQERADTYFPDQPILLAFQRKGQRVLVTSKAGDETRTADADFDELMSALREAGTGFFAHLARLVPANARSYEMALSELAQ
jgi:hypothetical protein